MEELQDVYKFMMLYYCRDIPKLKAAARAKKLEAVSRCEAVDDDDEWAAGDSLKQASRNSMYTMCVQAGLGSVEGSSVQSEGIGRLILTAILMLLSTHSNDPC